MKSYDMQLSGAERRWLPWLGRTGKLAMGWSCWLNRSTYPVMEQVFEGIAETRVRLLLSWARSQWAYLAELAEALGQDFSLLENDLLQDKLQRSADFSELFVVSPEGLVLASSWPHHCQVGEPDPRALASGLRQPFLHGPYRDPLTLEIGPSSSRFHDEVTLMFYQPIRRDGQVLGCLCGRVPNDVLGDLIQREAGHVYKDSGDNYLFMVESRFDRSIAPGIALSRSRCRARASRTAPSASARTSRAACTPAGAGCRSSVTPSWSCASSTRPPASCTRGCARPFARAATCSSPIPAIPTTATSRWWARA